MTYVAADGSWRQRQMLGTVASLDRGRGIDIALGGKRAGETFRPPPDTVAFRRAAPGHDRLRGTGEVVVDPAFLVTYEVHAAAIDEVGRATGLLGATSPACVFRRPIKHIDMVNALATDSA